MASRRETVVFRVEDGWLAECVDKIVCVKRAAGIKTSFSFELVRLARVGLTGEFLGAEFDKKAIKDDSA